MQRLSGEDDWYFDYLADEAVSLNCPLVLFKRQWVEITQTLNDCIYALPAMLHVRRQFSALKALALYENELIALLDVSALQQIVDEAALD